MTQKTFVTALKDFFGYKPGQTAMEFVAEVKALSPDDRAYFKAEFAKIGIEITN